MLKRLRLKDFKSFVDGQVDLAPLTLLVGANASGKSNFLDALQFLHGLSFDLELEQILNGEQRASPDAWRGLRGGSQEAARFDAASFTIENTWVVTEFFLDNLSPDLEPAFVPHTYTHRLDCRTSPRPLLEAERLYRDKRLNFKTGALRGEQIEVLMPRPFDPGDSMELASARRSALCSMPPKNPKNPFSQLIDPSSPKYVLIEAFKSISLLSIRPEAMRGYGRREGPLGPEGQNFSGVLARLCDDLSNKQSLVDWIAEFCAPEIADIDFVGVKELGDVMAMFVEKGGKRISARSISDGTLHFLGILLALKTAEPESVILIEDIETGMHPTRLRLLVEYLQSVTRERDIQVIATTHSPVMLQWLKLENLRDVIVFGRVPDQEGTLMRRLGDIPHFEEVIQRTGIEELFSTGWLEMAL